MSHIGKTLAELGLLPDSFVKEMQRWGKDVPTPATQDMLVYPSPQKVDREIREVLEGEELVTTRETDLDAMKAFRTSAREGKLTLVADDGTESSFAVTFYTTRIGTILIPWASEGLEEILTNGKTSLEGPDGSVTFSNVHDLFFGDNKLFMELTVREA